MANLEDLKKFRKAERAAFTKTYNKVEELMTLQSVDISVLESELNVFKSKADRLEVTHAGILEALPELEFDAEFEIIEIFRDKAIRIETRARRIIDNQQIVSTVFNSVPSDSAVINSFENVITEKRKFKLPKLELRKFDGDVKEWLHFWSQFEKIHDDSSIANSDKFQYLLQATVEGSRAREVIESFPPTGDNYPKAIDCLKTRFGRNDLQIEVYVRELLKLVLKNANSNFSSSNLCALYDNLEQQIRALETLGVTTEKSAALLNPLVESCMPEEFLRAWQRSANFNLGSDPKTRLDSLLTFLKTEVESEERINLAMNGFGLKDDSSHKNRSKLDKEKAYTAASLLSTSTHAGKICGFCNGKHESKDCFKARKMSSSEKIKILKEKGYCFKCLKAGGHRAEKCRSFVKCIICDKMHYAIMCTESNKNINKSDSNNPEKEIKVHDKSVNLASISNTPQVLLQTLNVKVKGKNRDLVIRALYDSGSQKSYIRRELTSVLGLTPLRQQLFSHALFGGEKTKDELHNVYKIELGSLDGDFHCNFDVVDQQIICNNVPSVSYGPWIDELKFMSVEIFDTEDNSGPIDVLIGADVAGRLFTGKRIVLSSGLVAMESYLGWTIMGKTNFPSVKEDTAMMAISMFVSKATISDLFSLELLGIRDPVEVKSKKENQYLTKLHFEETVKINEDSRYEVTLPWRTDHLPLPSNKELAIKRLQISTKKLHYENLFTDYDNVFNEWASLGIIEDAPSESSSYCHHEHFLPHRPVVKQQGTTKVRPVFDASAKQVGSPSLNQCLEPGPNLLELIPNLLLRFREHKYGIVADIEKAFLQISVRPEDRNYLKFFWWNGKNENPKVMRHARVVFGVKSSPFLLEAVLEHHLKKYLENSKYNQRFVHILLRSFYVDDLVTSLDNESEILPFMQESHHILAEGKFNLRGWQYTGDDNPEQVTSVLGLFWNRREDELKVNLDWLETYRIEIVSKRVILSVTHRIFDPIGFLCPVLLIPKLMLQKMFRDSIPWDTEVEDNKKQEFLRWFNELNSLKILSIARCFSPAVSRGQYNISVHTFCDASQVAYAAVVFVRVEYIDVAQVHLLAAKSRVAPVKSITIPRLELLAATVGARLCKSVINALQYEDIKQHFWTDSTTVLSWIQREENWTVFVNNRVTEIRKLTDPTFWKHLPGTQNPADLPSRGCSAQQLLCSRWWEGPTWLRKSKENWPVTKPVFDEESVMKERRKTNITSNSIQIISSLNQTENGYCSKNYKDRYASRKNSGWYYCYFSSYNKMIRMVAWMKRFIFNCRNSISRNTGELSHNEVKLAEQLIVKIIQDEYFSHDVNKKKLNSLITYKDVEGILRVKTKITYRKDSEDFKNPIILPSHHQVVERLIMTEHKKNCHAGLQMLLNILREHYWILSARKTVRSVLSKCVICLRYAKRNVTTHSASLPENRVRDAAVFEIIGFDLAGPLYLKGESKAWICIYTCAVFRAVHFELLSSLTTEAFLQSFRRFIARRGRPSIVYCDNGSNFTGASNYLKLVNWDEIAQFSSVRKIQWFFNPPSAPWWGGFWERLIGVMKQILRRVLGKALLSYEEMVTILCDAELVMNSRPLSYVSEKDSELIPLSPNSFLQDFRKTGVPDFDQIDEIVLNKRIKYRKQLMSDLRKRFRSEYLGLLIQRHEHKKQRRQIQLGEVVLIGNDNIKCTDWILGFVIELLPGKDGISRLVRLRTSKGELLRPVQRIFPLEVSSSWFKDRQKDMLENANNEVSCETPDNKAVAVVFKSRSGRVIKLPQKLDL